MLISTADTFSQERRWKVFRFCWIRNSTLKIK